MHSIAKAFSRERDRQCPTCQGARRVYVEGKYMECYHCGGKGLIKLVE
jgi:DnaJ-class molecular chaperone